MTELSTRVTMIVDLVGSRRHADRAWVHRAFTDALAAVNRTVPAEQPLEPTVGDEAQARYATVEEALSAGVSVGAHPGLPDLAGFGRRVMEISAQEARDLVRYQVGAVNAFVVSNGSALDHIKPHGALFGMMAKDAELMNALCDVALDLGVPVYGLAGTEHERVAAARGVGFVSEFYVDLDYAPDGTVRVNRAGTGRDLAEVEERTRRALRDGTTTAVDGTEIAVRAESFCVHSDLPNAPEVARTVRRIIEE